MDKLAKKVQDNMDAIKGIKVSQNEWDFMMQRYLSGDQDLALGTVVALMRAHVEELTERINRMEKKFKFYSKAGKDGLI